MPASKYSLPDFLKAACSGSSYRRWLSRKATAHFVRDRKRGNEKVTREAYKAAIHEAVLRCEGRDEYTGRTLDWKLIGTYDNEQSRREKRAYKKGLGNLPTVDHVGDGLGPANFKICSWRVNDCKNDLDLEEFLEICRAVIRHHESK